MISDDELYRLAIFLGSCAMMMVVLYHFLEVNAKPDQEDNGKNIVERTSTSATMTTTPIGGQPSSSASPSLGTAVGGGATGR